MVNYLKFQGLIINYLVNYSLVRFIKEKNPYFLIGSGDKI